MKRTLQIIPLVSLLLILFMTYANTVDDLDLWWHLKSGQTIFETGAIPDKDDFAYTSSVPGERQHAHGNETDGEEMRSQEKNRFWSSRFIKRNWLSQIIFYHVFLLGGTTGIGILKSSLFVLSCLIMYLAMLRKGADPASSFLVICLVAFIGLDFNYSRPQLFSYLLFSSMMFLLYDYKRGGKITYLMPIIFLLWANLHGGFVLGVLVILTFTLSESIQFALFTRFGLPLSSPTKNQLIKLAVSSLSSVAASLLNPAGYSAFLFPFNLKESVFSIIEEYQRPMLYEYHAFWLMLILVIMSALIVIFRRRKDITDIFISCSIILPALQSNKYIMYFALGTSVFLACSLTSLGKRIKEETFFKKFFRGTALKTQALIKALSFVIALVALITLYKIYLSGDVLKFDMREERYPDRAIAFIKENRPGGNMFNLYNWGGYIIWHLYPDYRAFIYGRNVNETAFIHYNQILNASTGNDAGTASPLWKKLLDSYSVNFIITSALSSTGHVIPLVDRLYQDKEWALVFMDGKSMVFLKVSHDNEDIIHEHSLSKEKIHGQIISECRRGIAATPAMWGYYETLGFVYMKQNRLNDALRMFGKYLSMNPNNQKVSQSYGLLKRYLEQKGN